MVESVERLELGDSGFADASDELDRPGVIGIYATVGKAWAQVLRKRPIDLRVRVRVMQLLSTCS